MSLPERAYFDANLPGASQTVRIASLYDAKIFVRRWVIRDRDPALKALLRNVEKARSFATTESAIGQLTQALPHADYWSRPVGSHISASTKRDWPKASLSATQRKSASGGKADDDRGRHRLRRTHSRWQCRLFALDENCPAFGGAGIVRRMGRCNRYGCRSSSLGIDVHSLSIRGR